MKKTEEKKKTEEIYYGAETDYVKVVDEQTIDHPSYYTNGSMEVIDIIDLVLEHTGGSFTIGNAIKYICRHATKGTAILDLEKAIWYLKREINKLEEYTVTTKDIQGDTKRR